MNIFKLRGLCRFFSVLHKWKYFSTSHDYRRQCVICDKQQRNISPWTKWENVNVPILPDYLTIFVQEEQK